MVLHRRLLCGNLDGKTGGCDLVSLRGSTLKNYQLICSGEEGRWDIQPTPLKEPSDGNDALLDGEVDQLGAIMEVQRFHHLIFVELDGTRRNAQGDGNLFGRTAFGEQLQNLAQARSEFGDHIVVAFLPAMESVMMKFVAAHPSLA